jgi:hypothetical protein
MPVEGSSIQCSRQIGTSAYTSMRIGLPVLGVRPMWDRPFCHSSSLTSRPRASDRASATPSWVLYWPPFSASRMALMLIPDSSDSCPLVRPRIWRASFSAYVCVVIDHLLKIVRSTQFVQYVLYTKTLQKSIVTCDYL